jgi:hypothetical protein
VPSGDHEVEVYYDAGRYGLPLALSLLSLLALGLLAGFGLRRSRGSEPGETV